MLNGLLHVDGFLSGFLPGFGFSLGYVVKHPAQLSVDVSSEVGQVWQLTQIILLACILKKTLTAGQINDPS